jgi:hypothetical protein
MLGQYNVKILLTVWPLSYTVCDLSITDCVAIVHIQYTTMATQSVILRSHTVYDNGHTVSNTEITYSIGLDFSVDALISSTN